MVAKVGRVISTPIHPESKITKVFFLTCQPLASLVIYKPNIEESVRDVSFQLQSYRS